MVFLAYDGKAVRPGPAASGGGCRYRSDSSLAAISR
jgi:hypothetical protein